MHLHGLPKEQVPIAPRTLKSWHCIQSFAVHFYPNNIFKAQSVFDLLV
jgi:hypothetical protein